MKGEQTMKHLIFYISILLISFSAISADKPAEKGSSPIAPFSAFVEGKNGNPPPSAPKTEGRSGGHSPPASEAKGSGNPPPTSEAKGSGNPPPTSEAVAEGAPKDHHQKAQIFLENTNIAQAIIEGDIKKYETALEELRNIFNIETQDILVKQTSDGKTLEDLMITPKQNKEYFATELIHLLTLNNIRALAFNLDENKINNYLKKINRLIKVAKEANNSLAVKLLTNFNIITTKMYQVEQNRVTQENNSFNVAKSLQDDLDKANRSLTERLTWVESALDITQNPEYNINLKISGILRSVVSGVLIGVGTSNVLNASLYADTSWNMQVGTKLAQWMTHFPALHLTPEGGVFIFGTALIISGAIGVTSGYNRCSKAFQKTKAIKNIKNLLNREKSI